MLVKLDSEKTLAFSEWYPSVSIALACPILNL